jgi:hypothetical protein
MLRALYPPCRQHSYVPGLVLLYDKRRLHREVLAVYMQAGDHNSLISACIQYGDAAAGARGGSCGCGLLAQRVMLPRCWRCEPVWHQLHVVVFAQRICGAVVCRHLPLQSWCLSCTSEATTFMPPSI